MIESTGATANAISASCQSIATRAICDDRDGDQVLGEEDEAVPQEEPHGLEIDRRARHELARLVRVEEAERQALEVRVHRVSQVVLDGQREPAGEQAPEEHEDALDRAGHDDQGREGVEAAIAVARGRDGVDHLPRQVRHREAGGLGADGEQRRDDHLPPVRSQETEQPPERHPLRLAGGESAARQPFRSCWRSMANETPSICATM